MEMNIRKRKRLGGFLFREKSKGSISLMILLSFSLLLFIWMGTSYIVQAQAKAVADERVQTRCLYGAERGLTWALWAVKGKRLKAEQGHYSLPQENGVDTEVIVEPLADQSLLIESKGVDKEVQRLVRLRMRLMVERIEEKTSVKVLEVYSL